MRLITYTFELPDFDNTVIGSVALPETMPATARIARALDVLNAIRGYGLRDREHQYFIPSLVIVREDERIIAYK